MINPRFRPSPARLLLVIGAACAVLFIVLPFIGLATRTPWGHFIDHIGSPNAQTALWLSIGTSLASTSVCIALGVPIAWLLARHQFPLRGLVRAVVTVPMVLPPVVAGAALLAVFGRGSGFIGRVLFNTFDTQLTFSPLGVIVAQSFVALPFFVIAAETGIAAVDKRFELVASTLGGTPTFVALAVTLRLALPALVAGAVLAWARAFGEFGATITFAGNIEGRTQTLPLSVYMLLESDPNAAFALSVVMVAVAIVVLVLLRGRYLGRSR